MSALLQVSRREKSFQKVIYENIDCIDLFSVPVRRVSGSFNITSGFSGSEDSDIRDDVTQSVSIDIVYKHLTIFIVFHEFL